MPALCSLVTGRGKPPSIQPSSGCQEDTDKCCWKYWHISACEEPIHPCLRTSWSLNKTGRAEQCGGDAGEEYRWETGRQAMGARTPVSVSGLLLAGHRPRLCLFLSLHLMFPCSHVWDISALDHCWGKIEAAWEKVVLKSSDRMMSLARDVAVGIHCGQTEPSQSVSAWEPLG